MFVFLEKKYLCVLALDHFNNLELSFFEKTEDTIQNCRKGSDCLSCDHV